MTIIWKQLLAKKCKKKILCRFSGFLSSHRIQIQLNQLNENIFPILGWVLLTFFLKNFYHFGIQQRNYICSDSEYQKDKECHNGNASGNKKFKSDESIVTSTATEKTPSPSEVHPILDRVSTSTCYHLRPNKGLDRLNESAVSPDEYLTEATSIPGFVESLDDLKRQLRQNYANEKISRSDEYPKIVFLGTGSCIPNKARNVSAILVHTT